MRSGHEKSGEIALFFCILTSRMKVFRSTGDKCYSEINKKSGLSNPVMSTVILEYWFLETL